MESYTLIKETDGYKITLDDSNEIFNVTLKTENKYNEELFNEFLLYFTNTWQYIHKKKLNYYLLIELRNSSTSKNDIPLDGYMKLIKSILDINNILNINCHCICIISGGDEAWKTAYTFVTKLFTPDKQRPLLFTEDDDEKNTFFKSHRIIKPEYDPNDRRTWYYY